MVSSVDKEEKYKSSGFCDISCLQGLVLACNVLFIFAGAFVFGVGVYSIVSKMQFVAVLGSAYYNFIIALLIISGLMVFLTGILGCVGASRKNAKYLFLYSIFVCLIFFFELIAGILAFSYSGSIHDELSETMLGNLKANYNQTGKEALTEAVDKMQQQFQCCGVLTYNDWVNSTFILENRNGYNLKTPTSCCKSPSPKCSTSDHPSNIYRILGSDSMGCLIKLELYVKDHLYIIAIVAIAVACFQLIVILVSCGLRRAILTEENKI